MVYCYKNSLGHYSFKIVVSSVRISWSLVVERIPQNITTSSVSWPVHEKGSPPLILSSRKRRRNSSSRLWLLQQQLQKQNNNEPKKPLTQSQWKVKNKNNTKVNFSQFQIWYRSRFEASVGSASTIINPQKLLLCCIKFRAHRATRIFRGLSPSSLNPSVSRSASIPSASSSVQERQTLRLDKNNGINIWYF